jgi:hypothetical protein
MGTLVIDAATREKLVAAVPKGKFRVRLVDDNGELFGEFTKITKVGDRYVLGDWPSAKELEEIERKDLRYTPEQVMKILQRIKEEL